MKTQLHHRIKITTIIPCLFALLLAAGCASTKITDQQPIETGKITKPGNILVYNFAASAAELPAESTLADHPDLDATPQTAEQIAEGQKLGAQIAAELVAQIQAMGMPAQVASAQTPVQLNDLVIHGYLVSIVQGSEATVLSIAFHNCA